MPPLPHPRLFGWTLSLLFGLLFVCAYGGANLVAEYLVPWRIHPALAWDEAVPFQPVFALWYLSLTPMMLYAVHRLDWPAQWSLLATLTLQLAIACLLFVLLPVETAYPPRISQDWSGPWFALADALSLSRNHLPSLHTAFALTTVWLLLPVVSRLEGLFLSQWALGVIASTLLIHEHHLLDIAAGGLLAWLACRHVPRWALQPARLARVRLEWLWWLNLAAFARRHRRYALIGLMLTLLRLRRPAQGTLLLSGFVLLQMVDDVMDGDRRLPVAAEIWMGRLLAAWQRGVFGDEDSLLLAADFHRRLQSLPDHAAARADVNALLHTMFRDYARARQQAVWPADDLARQHRATFDLSLNLLLAATQAGQRANALPALSAALAWCSVMRDLREDLAAGIINIPADIWAQLRPLPNGTPDAAWLQQAPLQQWMRHQHQQAGQLLDRLDQQLAGDGLDPATQRIARLFGRSVRDFARRRFFRLYPWLRAVDN